VKVDLTLLHFDLTILLSTYKQVILSYAYSYGKETLQTHIIRCVHYIRYINNVYVMRIKNGFYSCLHIWPVFDVKPKHILIWSDKQVDWSPNVQWPTIIILPACHNQLRLNHSLSFMHNICTFLFTSCDACVHHGAKI